MIQLHRLAGFYAVARAEGYARAARTFPYPITHAGVHQQVRKLEEEVGRPLFERVGKDRVALTPEGRALFEFIAPFVEKLPTVIDQLRSGQLGGTLRVDAGALVLRQLLPQWLRRLRSARPDIRVELAEAKTADLGRLRSGEADLLIDWVDAIPEDIAAREVAETRAFLVLPSHHPMARKRKVSLEALGDAPFIAYNADRRLRALQLQALELHGISPPIASSADSAETILGFVAAGIGFSLVPAFHPAGPSVPGVTAVALQENEARFPVYALWRKRSTPHPLIDAALSVAPRLRGDG